MFTKSVVNFVDDPCQKSTAETLMSATDWQVNPHAVCNLTELICGSLFHADYLLSM